jgi:large subunit ribosomal protein L22
MKSVISNIRISPKKLSLVAEMVRRKSVVQADSILRFTTKKAAEIIRKALASAVANAENNFKQDKESLYIEEIVVGKGPTLKRFNPVSRGRAHPILKRMSMITIKVGVMGEMPAPKASKAEAAEAADTSTKTTKAKAPKTTSEKPKAAAKKSSVKVTKKS